MKTTTLLGALATLALCPILSARTPSPVPQATATPTKPTLASFTGLPQGTTMPELQKKVGYADEIVGSGVGYYIWHLADGIDVTALCNDGRKIEFIDYRKDGVKTKLYSAEK